MAGFQLSTEELIPRSIHISRQPRRHVMVVAPAGASTTSSKLGSDACAFAAPQPVPSNAGATSVLTMIVLIGSPSCCGDNYQLRRIWIAAVRRSITPIVVFGWRAFR